MPIRSRSQRVFPAFLQTRQPRPLFAVIAVCAIADYCMRRCRLQQNNKLGSHLASLSGPYDPTPTSRPIASPIDRRIGVGRCSKRLPSRTWAPRRR